MRTSREAGDVRSPISGEGGGYIIEIVRPCQNCEIRSNPNADTNECKILGQGHEKRSDEKS